MSEMYSTTRQPVPTRVLADMVNQPMRSTRWHLHRLEEHGEIARKSPRTGWLPARALAC